MRRALLPQALVIAHGTLTPPAIRVIVALIRQDEHVLVELNHPVVVVCHAGILMAGGDIVWRQPEPDKHQPDRYEGPPPQAPLPSDFHLSVEEQPAPARQLPALDHDAIDDAEGRATRLTYAVAFTAVAVMILVACWHLR